MYFTKSYPRPARHLHRRRLPRRRGPLTARTGVRAPVNDSVPTAEPSIWRSLQSRQRPHVRQFAGAPDRAIGRVKAKPELSGTPVPEPPFGASRVANIGGLLASASAAYRRLEDALGARFGVFPDCAR